MATLILNPETPAVRFVTLDKPFLLIGSAQDADVRLEDDSLANHCARIEKKPDGFYIISLDSAGGVVVNGVDTSFQRINHGDKIEFGEVKAVLLLSDEEIPEHAEGPEYEEPAQEFMPVAFSGNNGMVAVQRGPSQCPQCGYPLSQGMANCPQCGLHLSNLPAMPMGFVPPVPPSQIGPGILPIIAFLAALTVFGAPIALVLGLMSLSIIRRRGGTVRDRALAKWSVGLGLVWLMLGAVAAAGMIKKAQNRKQLNIAEIYETKVIRSLKNLACAQKYARTIEAFDVDADGQGEYGTLAGLPKIKSPFFDIELADGEGYGYLFTIRESSEGQFLVVAEPIRYGATGIRTFTIDQTGQIRGGDTEGQRFGQIASSLPVLQGERNAYYEIDDQIAIDVLNHIKSLSSTLPDQEKKQRILRRLREDYALTSVGLGLEGMAASVDRFVSEEHAQAMYREANTAFAEGDMDVALSKMTEIQSEHPAFSKIAAVERKLSELRSLIAQQREREAQELFAKAEALERQGGQAGEVQRLYQQIASRYPKTAVASRVSSLTPELQRQMRERRVEDLFSELMELSPETDHEEILSRSDQLRRNYNDTELFAKVEAPLTEKERKARASSWRDKTEKNLAVGRMRGALAQLESAAQENTDLRYDLRDLFITLYCSVAGTLVEEGDARKALTYYERHDQLLQAKGSEETTSPDLLAKLHNDVGQADFERKEYETAKWHLDSAAWKYQNNATFNTKLGVANLYLGLYKPAKVALNRALAARPKMSSALLYRSYLDLRSTLTMEQVLAKSFQQDEPEAAPEPVDSDPVPAESTPVSSVVISIEGRDMDPAELEQAIRNAGPAEKIELKSPEKLNLKPSGAGEEWFSRFEANQMDDDTTLLGPRDLDLFLDFDYQKSRGLMLGFMQVLEGLHQQKSEYFVAIKEAKAKGAKMSKGGNAATKAAISKVTAANQKIMMEYRSQLQELRKAHVEDLATKNGLFEMMNDIKQRLRAASNDLQAAAEHQPKIQTLTAQMLSQINAKYNFLDEANKLISFAMEKEINVREDMMDLAEEILEKDKINNSEETALKRDLSRVKKKLFDERNLTNIDQALRSLRESMSVRIDLDNILRAADRNI